MPHDPTDLKNRTKVYALRMALVHKSKSRRNPFVESGKLCHFITLRHTQVCHFIKSGATH